MAKAVKTEETIEVEAPKTVYKVYARLSDTSNEVVLFSESDDLAALTLPEGAYHVEAVAEDGSSSVVDLTSA